MTIIKLRPDGSEAARYPATLLPSPEGWIVVRAVWGRPTLDLGYLVFEPDDVFLEYFALSQPFNAFALYSPRGALKGWYCNVTHPTLVSEEQVVWHDLYLDVIVYPDGRQLLLDEDELAEAAIHRTDPALLATIVAGARELQRRAARREYPFSEDGSVHI